MNILTKMYGFIEEGGGVTDKTLEMIPLYNYLCNILLFVAMFTLFWTIYV